MKTKNTPLTTSWWTYDTTSGYPRVSKTTRHFVEATSEWNAKGALVDRGIGTACDGCDWSCEGGHTPYIYAWHEEVPAKDEERVVDLKGVTTIEAHKHDAQVRAFVIRADGTMYEAWQTTTYVNPAKFDGEHGYGVRVWAYTNVSDVFPVNAAGWDKTGNHNVPAYGKGVFSTLKTESFQIGNGYVESMGDYYAVWFPTKAEATAFRKSIKAWQATLPKFDIAEHTPKEK